MRDSHESESDALPAVTKEMIEAVAWSASSQPGMPFGMILTDEDIKNVLSIGIANAPPPQTHETVIEDRPWRPWIDMPVGNQRNVVREVRSEDGRTALAYWTGKFMALAPVSDDPVELPFKVSGQRPPPQDQPGGLVELNCGSEQHLPKHSPVLGGDFETGHVNNVVGQTHLRNYLPRGLDGKIVGVVEVGELSSLRIFPDDTALSDMEVVPRHAASIEPMDHNSNIRSGFSPSPPPNVVDQLRCHERPKSEYQCDRNEADHHKDASEASATFTRKEHDVHSANNGEDEQKRHTTPGAYEPILGAAATTSPSTDVTGSNTPQDGVSVERRFESGSLTEAGWPVPSKAASKPAVNKRSLK